LESDSENHFLFEFYTILYKTVLVSTNDWYGSESIDRGHHR